MLWLMLLALIPGSLAIAARPAGLARDPDGYLELAEQWYTHGVYGYARPSTAAGDPKLKLDPKLEHHAQPAVRHPLPYPSAYRPPFYPLLLVPASALGAYGFAWIAGLHLVLHASTVIVLVRTAQQLYGRRGAIVAAIALAFDPILLAQLGEVMTETLAAAATTAIAAAWCLACMQPSRAAAAMLGVVMGLAILCRPTYLPWCLALIAILAWHARATKLWRMPAIALGVAALILSPWAIRNAFVFGRPILTTTHGGYTLLLGNHARHYELLERMPPWQGDGWRSDAFDLAPLEAVPPAHLSDYPLAVIQPATSSAAELANDARARSLALARITSDPAGFARAAAYRELKLWSISPHRTAGESRLRTLVRYAIGGWYLVLYALCIAGLVRLGRRFGEPLWLGLLLWPLILSAVHLGYWSEMRMRAQMMPVIVLVAAAGVRPTINRRETP